MRANPQPSRVLLAVLTGSAVLALAACGSGDDASSGSGASAAAGDQKVAAVIKGLDNTFFQTMQSGIDAQAKTAGMDVEVQAAASITDTTGQADRLTAMAQQKYGCYIVNPITGNNLVQGLAQIARQKVPVVNIDRPVDAAAAKAAGVEISTYIGTNNVAAAKLAGTKMAEDLGSGKVALIGGVAGDVTSNDRITGFTQGSAGKLTLLPVQAADWERQKALTAATDLLNSNPDLKGFFAANDDMGLGIARAVANAGKTGDIAVMSVDGNKDALEAVQSGDLTATVAQYPYAVGTLGVEACKAAMDGKTLPANIEAPVALITKDDAADAIGKFPQPFKAFDDPLANLG